jgi:hypothetical protein
MNDNKIMMMITTHAKEVVALHLLKEVCFYIHIQMMTDAQKSISTAVF